MGCYISKTKLVVIELGVSDVVKENRLPQKLPTRPRFRRGRDEIFLHHLPATANRDSVDLHGGAGEAGRVARGADLLRAPPAGAAGGAPGAPAEQHRQPVGRRPERAAGAGGHAAGQGGAPREPGLLAQLPLGRAPVRRVTGRRGVQPVRHRLGAPLPDVQLPVLPVAQPVHVHTRLRRAGEDLLQGLPLQVPAL